ncbi:hypothetical protein V8G69_16135 [Gaetbulibacter sp. M235]|uniref:hypothetical protein n=1 Tax=Gaetbulibacter sp. M235 TaxID=3126510 RepID=UPI00374EED44
MDIFQIIFGRYLIELIGASIRFSFGYIKSKLFGTKLIKFENYWHKKKGNQYDKLETETANRIAGFFFFAIFIGIIIYFTI